jgi:hypothetical protein
MKIMFLGSKVRRVRRADNSSSRILPEQKLHILLRDVLLPRFKFIAVVYTSHTHVASMFVMLVVRKEEERNFCNDSISFHENVAALLKFRETHEECQVLIAKFSFRNEVRWNMDRVLVWKLLRSLSNGESVKIRSGVWNAEVDRSVSCPMADFHIISVEHSNSTASMV